MAQTSFQYQIRGILYYGIDKLEESLHDFNKAIELCPDLSGHYVWRAAIHYESAYSIFIFHYRYLFIMYYTQKETMQR